ncbi:hypothetical protein SAMN05428987_0269 [Paenibacillus sp. CF095]|uniref:DUF6602 domain-containing protein n=1 Tax=Paenibacillus sp. CF095 TaxID=1881033 RepID=UPI00088BBF45|nr:DUF6602 domain-containing protein [Paenibacillus sp. CF095]SDE03620.1 hypothetical protein SAMN05428987_0269 [Paenibacillus sp. CF095]
MNSNPLKLIFDNYNELNNLMVKEIELATAHPGLTGSYREEMWVKFFRSIIPQKFSFVHGAMIIDSEGGISNEVDIAVIDEQYTPYIFQYHTLKLIPIEAVSMVIECKSTDLPTEQLETWAKKIDSLHAKNTGIARMATGYATGVTNATQSRSQPIKVLVSIKKSVKDRTLMTTREELGEYFDFIIQEQIDKTSDNTKFEVLVKNEKKTLGWWGRRLNQHISDEADHSGLALLTSPDQHQAKNFKECKIHLETKAEQSPDGKDISISYISNKLEDLRIPNNPLLTLNLQLNQLLMLVNNPMLFPHFAYANAFQNLVQE